MQARTDARALRRTPYKSEPQKKNSLAGASVDLFFTSLIFYEFFLPQNGFVAKKALFWTKFLMNVFLDARGTIYHLCLIHTQEYRCVAAQLRAERRPKSEWCLRRLAEAITPTTTLFPSSSSGVEKAERAPLSSIRPVGSAFATQQPHCKQPKRSQRRARCAALASRMATEKEEAKRAAVDDDDDVAVVGITDASVAGGRALGDSSSSLLASTPAASRQTYEALLKSLAVRVNHHTTLPTSTNERVI